MLWDIHKVLNTFQRSLIPVRIILSHDGDDNLKVEHAHLHGVPSFFITSKNDKIQKKATTEVKDFNNKAPQPQLYAELSHGGHVVRATR